jgi:ABC-type transporter Mla MlaB component
MEDELTDQAPSEPQQPSVGAARPSTPLVLDVGEIARPDLGTLDALCQIVLEGRRSGCEVRLRGAGRELLELLDLAGLRSVLAGRRQAG